MEGYFTKDVKGFSTLEYELKNLSFSNPFYVESLDVKQVEKESERSVKAFLIKKLKGTGIHELVLCSNDYSLVELICQVYNPCDLYYDRKYGDEFCKWYAIKGKSKF